MSSNIRFFEKILSLRWTFIPLLMAMSSLVSAQNKVVVIPMAGDELAPFALVAADDTNSANYSANLNVVIDNTTGLEWQRNSDDEDYDYVAAKIECLNLDLDGKSDWRLPTIKELMSIVDFGEFSPLIVGFVFPGTASEYYWSDTEISTSDDYRFLMDFEFGGIVTSEEGVEQDRRVRCVRSNGKSVNSPVFVDNNNGSITDKATGLIWQKQDDSVFRNHANAILYCQNLNLAGSSNWRLPALKELLSIVDYRLSKPVIDETIFPGVKTAAPYWSALTVTSNVSYAWNVRFHLGVNFSNYLKSLTLYVRCVR